MSPSGGGGGPFQRFPTPQFSPNVAQGPPQRAPPMGQPSIQHSAGQVQSFPGSVQPQPQPQPQTPFAPFSAAPSNVPPPVFQPSFPGYARNQAGVEMQAPPMQSPFPANQGNFGPIPPVASSPFSPHQGGYVPPPPVAAPSGGIQGLTEDFSSLLIQTCAGLMETSIDAKELPRPLEGDVEPKSLAEMYPMNCDPRKR